MTSLSDAFHVLEHALNPALARALALPRPDALSADLTHVLTYLRIMTRRVDVLTRELEALVLEAHPELAADIAANESEISPSCPKSPTPSPALPPSSVPSKPTGATTSPDA